MRSQKTYGSTPLVVISYSPLRRLGHVVAIASVTKLLKLVRNTQHGSPADDLGLSRVDVAHVVPTAVRRMPRPGQDVHRVASYEVQRAAEVVHDPDVRSIGLRGEQTRAGRPALGVPPTMEEGKTGAIGAEEQHVEVVLHVAHVAARAGDLRDVVQRDDQLLLAGCQVDAEDAGIAGRRNVSVRVRPSGPIV